MLVSEEAAEAKRKCWLLILSIASKEIIKHLDVTFELNVLLDLSWQATTKSLSPLQTKLVLQVLSESTRTMAIRVIRGDEGVGDIPGVQGGSRGGLKIVHNRLD